MLTERYVDDFTAALGHVDRKKKKALVEKVEYRIQRGYKQGQNAETIVAVLGPAETLAARMLADPDIMTTMRRTPFSLHRTLLSVFLFFLFLATLWPLLLAFVVFLGVLVVVAMTMVAGGAFFLIISFIEPLWPAIFQGLHYGAVANILLAIAWICFGLLLCIFLNRFLRSGASAAGGGFRSSLGLIFYRSRRKI